MFIRHLLLLAAIMVSVGVGPVLSGATEVECWDIFEGSISNTTPYADPTRNVTLAVTFTDPSGGTHNFWGFYDGGSTWRFRWLPDQLGEWQWNASFDDGKGSASGSFTCVPSSRHGLLTAYAPNPIWFARGGVPFTLRSFHIGDRFFATNWDDPSSSSDGDKRAAFLDWIEDQNYNCLSVASHFLNREQKDRGNGWDTPDLWDGPSRQLYPAEWRKMEVIMNDCHNRGIILFQFAGLFGQASDFPTNLADQELYIRYALARIGPYPLTMWNIAGPEPLRYPAQFQDAMSTSDIRRIGALFTSLDPFGHPLTLHGKGGDDPFVDDDWLGYSTLQGWKGKDWDAINAGMIKNAKGHPAYAQEVFWPGNVYGHGELGTDPDDIRAKAYVLLLSAAQINFADMDGNSSSGYSGSMDPADRHDYFHVEVTRSWDWFAQQNFAAMRPRQDLVTNGYCLADHGNEYLVYLVSGGSTSVSVTNGPYQVEWIKANNTSNVINGGTTSTGSGLSAPGSGDWLLRLHKGGGGGGNISPGAQASATPTSGFAPLPVDFSSAGSIDPDGSIVSYLWDFGDGTSASSASPSHTYSTIGSYTATLTVTDDDGATASDSVVITVSATPVPGEVQINFQPTTSAVPAGYLVDDGAAFGDRGNGQTYGWVGSANDKARERNVASDQRLDTLNHFENGGVRNWQIALANGDYDLFIACGDPKFADSLNSLEVEGTLLSDPDGTDNLDEFTLTVTISDGVLDITQAASGNNAKISYIHVTPSGGGVTRGVSIMVSPLPSGVWSVVRDDAADSDVLDGAGANFTGMEAGVDHWFDFVEMPAGGG